MDDVITPLLPHGKSCRGQNTHRQPAECGENAGVPRQEPEELSFFGVELRRMIAEAGYKKRSRFLKDAGLENVTVRRWELSRIKNPDRELFRKASAALRAKGLDYATVEYLYRIYEESRARLGVVAERPLVDPELNEEQIRKMIDDWEPRLSQEQRWCWGNWHQTHAKWNRITRTFVRTFFPELKKALDAGNSPDKACELAADKAAHAVDEAAGKAQNVTQNQLFRPPSTPVPAGPRKSTTRR